MNCKYCNAELSEDTAVCPVCGKDNAQESEQINPVVDETCPETEQTCLPEESTEAVEEITEEIPEEAVKPSKKLWKRILAAVCAVVVLVTLVISVLLGMGIDLKPRSNDAMYKASYTITNEETVNAPNKVIATMGDMTLDNELFQIYYWGQIYGFLDYYGSYYFDFSKPLDAQVFSEETGMTWQQYFVQVALESWKRYGVLNILAAEEGFVLDDAFLTVLPEQLEESAVNYGYEDAEAMVKADMGQLSSLESYLEYIKQTQTANQFMNQKYEQWEPTADALDAYYQENEAAFIESGITKESGPIVDVRHILVQPEGEKTDGEYSDVQWKECLQKAEKILDEWKNGEATEESFAKLANTYSADGGSNTTGGLYEGITPTSSYVKNFLQWSVDETRAVGDTDIVQTEFGYHIMYFVGGEPMWMLAARNNYQADMLNKMIEEGQARWPAKIQYKNIIVTDANVTG